MSEVFFKWDPTKYSIKVQAMDSEHQKLIDLMNVLHTKVEQKASKAELKKAITDLGDYTVKHFKHEEAFFDTLTDYKLKDAHKRIHQDLLQKFKTHADNFDKTGEVTHEFFVFLKVWLTAHIAGIDMKYGEISNKKAA